MGQCAPKWLLTREFALGTMVAMSVILLGTLDTKGEEYAWLRDRLVERGVEVVVVDVGVLGAPRCTADVERESVAVAGGTSIAALTAAGDRGAALRAMTHGATALVRERCDAGEVGGILAVAGSGGSAIAAGVMQALPVGLPKLLVSTMASGDVAPYVGVSDVTLMYSVVDIAGLNSFSERILGNAAAAIAGMAGEHAARAAAGPAPDDGRRPIVAATMFGVTMPAVDVARRRLDELGYETLVFHATGSGGRAMEALIDGGFVAGVLDLTTTELADDLVGGVLSAGPQRLEAAGRKGVPQVVSVGALDMVNFGPRDTVPREFEGRTLYVHNDTVTLMRTTAQEMEELGRRIGAKLSAATGPAVVFLPLAGVSALDRDGEAFADPAADEACFMAVKRASSPNVEVVELACHVNDEQFGRAMADRLDALVRGVA